MCVHVCIHEDIAFPVAWSGALLPCRPCIDFRSKSKLVVLKLVSQAFGFCSLQVKLVSQARKLPSCSQLAL